MKMSKKMAVFASALLLSTATFSAPGGKESLSRRCENVSYQLNDLFKASDSTPCAYKVRYAAFAMLNASISLKSNQYFEAMDNLGMAERNLNSINGRTQQCAYFSPKVKHPLYEVRGLFREIGDLSRSGNDS